METPIVRNIIEGDDKTPRFVDFYESEEARKAGDNKILGVDNFNKRYENWKNYPIRKGRY